MVRPSPVGDRLRLLAGLLAVCVVGACLAGSSLSALALADEAPPPPVCPGPVLEIPEEMPQPDREIRGLRNDLRESCAALFGSVGGVSSQLAQLVDGQGEVLSGLSTLDEDDARLLAALSPEGGVGVRFLGQVAPLETQPTAGSESQSEGNFSDLESAVFSNSETLNQDLWGLSGLFVGLVALGVLFKLVRP